MTIPSIRHLRPADYRVMPWKNGGGITTELIIEPAGSTLDTGFHWRLSMAEVGVSGPFSRFEGCDRTLLLLEGQGMRLEVGAAAPAILDRLLTPFRFSGDGTTAGHLLDGPCRDFNVISQRAHCRHHLEVLRLEATPSDLVPGAVRFAFCAKGEAVIEPLGVQLAEGDLLRVEGDPRSLRASGPATLISVGLDRTAASRIQ